ncbi:putative sterigmatocystin biosynthesis monooxygenase stcW [Fusarium oxysporum f. sp. narcissi]|uniref:Putative sterigmatocystin biosynthesis monooxygenase stcW n=1 Tax=Fusarium oxysporum f. sp. narcissi TaxID=451672 RepID=A0A4Q2V114_FUSOX|nr:putative sterigmatocystin biosynthesis monooxygenase stcW [Fusarium oxysporum f. sp. narcissi]
MGESIKASLSEKISVSNDAAPKTDPNWVPVLEAPVFKSRKLRVVCIGAGYSGLMLAWKWKYETPMDDFIDLVIYDKNPDVGGTWLVNRYPGVACDVPAHIYTFSFEPNPDWSSFYATGPEIWDYIKRTTKKYKLDERVQLNSNVTSSVWDGEKGKWKIKVTQDGRTIDEEADVLINATGLLSKWRWPDIKGIDSFEGIKVHSAAWDQNLDWTGKRVAVIGNGSSAIQILPQMQPKAAKITNFIRTPTWISSNYAAEFTPEGKNFQYTEEQKRNLRENPDQLFEMRRKIEHSFNQFFYALLVGTEQQKAVAISFKKMMETRLNNNPELCAQLIPEFKVGCRRLTPGEGYLEALQAHNVDIEYAPIERFTEKGIKTTKGEYEFDIIVCATGFDVSFVPHWELVGKRGVTLNNQWKDEPTAYMSTCAPNMPNYFMFNGPNCPVGHGSLLACMEWTAEYILKWCKKIASEDIKSVTVNEAATAEFNIYSQEFLKRTVWASGCRSWYKNNKVDGKVTAMYAGSILHFKEMLENFRTEDFDYEFNSSNRFRFMGNGLTRLEERGEDLSFYVKK